MNKLLVLLTFILITTNIKAQDSGENTVIRVLTFNILHGATTIGNFDLDKIASVIKDLNPDLVALQEVDFKTNRAKNYDLATELGLRTHLASLFGQAMPFDGGAYGEAILTKMPIVASRNVPLPHSPGNEPRTALAVTIELEQGDTICFVGTHLEHQENSADRIEQTRKINAAFSELKYPAILAGDFNAMPGSEPVSILQEQWTNVSGEEPSFPSGDPKIKIDYIFCRPQQNWQLLETRVICDEIASDHCAVLSVLRLIK